MLLDNRVTLSDDEVVNEVVSAEWIERTVDAAAGAVGVAPGLVREGPATRLLEDNVPLEEVVLTYEALCRAARPAMISHFPLSTAKAVDYRHCTVLSVGILTYSEWPWRIMRPIGEEK